MHEALEVKINELIDSGEEHKVQWGKLLQSFAGLELNRIVLSLESLTPSQLDSISDGIQRAKQKAKNRSLEAVKVGLLKEGIKISDFLTYLGVQVSGEMINKVDKPNNKKTNHNNRLSPQAKLILEELLITGKYSATQAVAIMKEKTGETATAATAYAMRAKLRKEGKMS